LALLQVARIPFTNALVHSSHQVKLPDLGISPNAAPRELLLPLGQRAPAGAVLHLSVQWQTAPPPKADPFDAVDARLAQTAGPGKPRTAQTAAAPPEARIPAAAAGSMRAAHQHGGPLRPAPAAAAAGGVATPPTREAAAPLPVLPQQASPMGTCAAAEGCPPAAHAQDLARTSAPSVHNGAPRPTSFHRRAGSVGQLPLIRGEGHRPVAAAASPAALPRSETPSTPSAHARERPEAARSEGSGKMGLMSLLGSPHTVNRKQQDSVGSDGLWHSAAERARRLHLFRNAQPRRLTRAAIRSAWQTWRGSKLQQPRDNAGAAGPSPTPAAGGVDAAERHSAGSHSTSARLTSPRSVARSRLLARCDSDGRLVVSGPGDASPTLSSAGQATAGEASAHGVALLVRRTPGPPAVISAEAGTDFTSQEGGSARSAPGASAGSSDEAGTAQRLLLARAGPLDSLAHVLRLQQQLEEQRCSTAAARAQLAELGERWAANCTRRLLRLPRWAPALHEFPCAPSHARPPITRPAGTSNF
jgi:hypothetical protein